MTTTIGFRAIPTPLDAREDANDNERRFRASVEDAMRRVDTALASIQADSGDCCGNIDGGEADTIYGGVFCPIDGGDASGAANST